MTQLLVSALIAATDLPAFVCSYTPATNAPTFMLLETQAREIVEPKARQDLLRFELFDPANPKFTIPPDTSGRVFHRYAELRWETFSQKVRIVFSGKSTYLPELPKSQEAVTSEKLDDCQPAIRNYFLYGKRLDEHQLKRIGKPAQEGDFAEVRIPRLLRYPSVPSEPKNEYLQLAVYEYIAPETGTCVAYRFYKLKSYVTRNESERKKSV